MNIYVNNKIENFDLNKNINIGQAIDKISSELKKHKKVICKVMVDNVAIPEDKEKEIFSFNLESVNSLSFKVDTVDNLILNAIASLKNLLPELIGIINKTANLHREGDELKAKNMFLSSLEAMELVPEILNNIRLTMNLDFRTIKTDDYTFSDLEEKMLKAISAVFDSQSREDYVSLADVLEYELVPNYTDWQKGLPILENECKERIFGK